jgi:hypothetical protein
MGWNWRKSINFGAARINLSKKGVGYSIGFRGFRVGQNAKQQQYSQTSIPGTGIYRRKFFGNSMSGRKWSLPLLIAFLLVLLLVKFFLRL